jgi:hypothetical protein
MKFSTLKLFFIVTFGLIFCIPVLAQSEKYKAMRVDLRVLNYYYQDEYVKNKNIDDIFKKIVKYRDNPDLGLTEYASKTEIAGLKDFEILQDKRDLQTLEIYRKYQTDEYVVLMDEYNLDRKQLRILLATKKITWRQFVDDLEMLIIKNRAKEKEYWEPRDYPKEAA